MFGFKCLFLACVLSAAVVEAAERVIWSDPLTIEVSPDVGSTRTNRGGEFSPYGWRVKEPRGFLRLSLPTPLPPDGELAVSIDDIEGARFGEMLGKDRKIHFLNLFSNVNGDHHAEAGGSSTDAIITLRTGTDDNGALRYGGDVKLLWASKGAKRATGSDYHEKRLRLAPELKWGAGGACRFIVRWSAARGELQVELNETLIAREKWAGAGNPLQHVFLGGAADFNALIGARFSNLVIKELSPAGSEGIR